MVRDKQKYNEYQKLYKKQKVKCERCNKLFNRSYLHRHIDLHNKKDKIKHKLPFSFCLDNIMRGVKLPPSPV